MVESFEIIWGGGAFVKVIITTEIFKVCVEGCMRGMENDCSSSSPNSKYWVMRQRGS